MEVVFICEDPDGEQQINIIFATRLISCNNPKDKSHWLFVEGTRVTPTSELSYRIRHPRSALSLVTATSSNCARYLYDSSSSNEQTAIIQQRVK